MRLTGMQRNIPPNKQSFTHSPIFVSGEAVANLVGANLSAPKLSSSSHLQNFSFTQVRIQIDMPHFAWYTTHRTSKERSIPMRTQSKDTSSEMERVQIELIRKASPAKIFGLVRSMSQTMIQASRRNIRKLHPDASEEELTLIFVELYYGKQLANLVRSQIEKRRSG